MSTLRWLATAAAIAAVFGLSGCPNTMNGKVDGDTVGPARDAIYDIAEVDFFGVEAAYVMIVITGVPNACEVWEDFDDVDWNDGCDDYCEELNEVAVEHLHHDFYWNLSISLHAEDDNSVEAEYDWDDEFGEEEFTASVERWDVSLLYDVDACEEECDDGDPVIDDDNGEDAEDGTVVISRYDSSDDIIVGDYEIEFDSADEVVSGQFKATECDLGLSDWVW